MRNTKRARCGFGVRERNRVLRNLLLVFSLFVAAGTAAAQSGRTIKIIVPFAPGAGSDILPRMLAEQVSRAHGVTFVVENRPGAGSVVGTEAGARAAPDGNSVEVTVNSFVINPHLRKVGYDPLASFEPICLLATTPIILVVNSSAPYRSLSDLLDAARRGPGELSMASVGPTSAVHLAFERLKRAANVNMTYVPFTGNGPALNALLGEHVTSAMVDYPSVIEQIRAGKLHAIATASSARVAALPDVPTVAESGFAGFSTPIWYGLVAPARTSPQHLTELSTWFTAALKDPEITAKLGRLGLQAVGACGLEFGSFLRTQHEEYGRVIREAGIKTE